MRVGTEPEAPHLPSFDGEADRARRVPEVDIREHELVARERGQRPCALCRSDDGHRIVERGAEPREARLPIGDRRFERGPRLLPVAGRFAVELLARAAIVRDGALPPIAIRAGERRDLLGMREAANEPRARAADDVERFLVATELREQRRRAVGSVAALGGHAAATLAERDSGNRVFDDVVGSAIRLERVAGLAEPFEDAPSADQRAP